MSNAIRLMQEQGLTIEEIDTLTGSALGWPKTGTFRLGDMVGVDVMAHVAKNFQAQAAAIEDERADVGLAPFIGKMLEKKWLGDKTGQGFYKKRGARTPRAAIVRLVIDWQTLDYKPSMRPKFPARRDGEERGVTRRAYPATASRRCEQGQSCGLLLAVPDGAFYLRANRVP